MTICSAAALVAAYLVRVGVEVEVRVAVRGRWR